MLTLLNLIQLVLYIALLALLGQGVLYVLAGPARQGNVFYRLLQVVGNPFRRVLRRLVPQTLGDGHVSVLTFALLAALYVVVTFARADWCVTSGLLGQAGCR
jgi:uncharacterized protein YggT (Ycf19 family)